MDRFSVLIEAYIRDKQDGKGLDFCAASWLDSASKRASQISVATHVLKYTHSDAKGSNICMRAESLKKDMLNQYVSTEALSKVREDVVGNAAAMDIAGLLHIALDGVTFLDLIVKDDSSPLARFASNETQLLTWMKGFKSILVDRELSSHTLAKQVYFPVEEGKYHLLAPLYASSLSQALYDRIKEDRFGDRVKEAKECKKNEKYSETSIIYYPDLAIQTFGGTKPQNISRLNSLRGGRSYLLKSAPPVWVSIEKPPLKKNEFWRTFERKVTQDLKEFKQFIMAVKYLPPNKDIKHKMNAYINQLLDWLISAAAEIQTMEPGWSKKSEVSLHEKIWLDPMSENFKEMRFTEDWKEGISKRFATWLVRKVENKNLKLDDKHHTYFSSECLKVLKEVE